MQFDVLSFGDSQPMPAELAFCVPDPDSRIALGPNRSPHVRWSELPDGTRSLALICHDPDVPSVGDDVNQQGRTIADDLPRVDFYHWVLVDIPLSVNELPEGLDSDGVTAQGKARGLTEYGLRGINDYTSWFAADVDMSGDYGGYDGPCPPWNDERLHHYIFTLYALSVRTLGLGGSFGGSDALAAMRDNVLDKATHCGTYTLNPSLRAG